jgi:hypothetical protein
MRLPLQNLWDAPADPTQMPVVLLPFSQYAIILIIGLLVVGGGVAGLVARIVRPRMPRSAPWLILGGLAAVQITAIVQTASVVGGGLAERSESAFYLGALVAVAVMAAASGFIAFLLIALAPRGGAVVGLSIAALALGPWLGALIIPFGSVTVAEPVVAVAGVLRFVPPVLVGIAIAWGGVATAGRVAAAVVGPLLVWLVPAIQTAIFNAAGSRVLASDLAGMRDFGVGVFFAALTTPAIALPPVGVAVAVAAVGLVGRTVARRRTSRAALAD